MNSFESELILRTNKVSDELKRYLTPEDIRYDRLYNAMRYSALAGGKRIRPFLTLSFCEMLGGTEEAAMPYACAIEMIHTYSLIHDDLPCMDNDDMRRGKPTSHKVFGETLALLAGDTLLTDAFCICASNPYVSATSAKNAVVYLSDAAGGRGMAGGQMIDTTSDGKIKSLSDLEHMYRLKTGALIAAASVLGVYAAPDVTTTVVQDAEEYSYNIGLAFQIQDDILDVIGNAEEFGKPIGSDQKNRKMTMLSFMSLYDAQKKAATLTEQAIASIEKYDKNNTLVNLANYLVKRKK